MEKINDVCSVEKIAGQFVRIHLNDNEHNYHNHLLLAEKELKQIHDWYFEK